MRTITKIPHKPASKQTDKSHKQISMKMAQNVKRKKTSHQAIITYFET